MTAPLTEDMRKLLGGGIGGAVGVIILGLVFWVFTTVGDTKEETQEFARQELRSAVSKIDENIKEVRTEATHAFNALRSEMYSNSREKEEALTRQLDKIIMRVEDLTKQVNRLQENLAVLLDKGRKG